MQTSGVTSSSSRLSSSLRHQLLEENETYTELTKKEVKFRNPWFSSRLFWEGCLAGTALLAFDTSNPAPFCSFGLPQVLEKLIGAPHDVEAAELTEQELLP